MRGQIVHLIHENVHSHTALFVTFWSDYKRILVSSWPPQSRDLNPFDHVWDILKHRITSHINNIQNTFRFRELLTADWARLLQEDIVNIISSINSKCRTVRNQRRDHTLYSAFTFHCVVNTKTRW